MNVVGPARLVLLRAGKYDYGEVELINPLHLVGPNNVGKTSLIAVLQFLYIDDQRSMHFSREMAETRKYYFPDQNSYLLFECLTPGGYQVVGVQGLGPVRGYEFQRFAYQGRYDAADYLDDERRLRPPEEVRARLAARDFRLLEPRHLRAALTGLGDNRGVNLGLVPIRQRDHYERFRSVFGNLLRLAHLRQEELKRFLLEIYRGEFQQGAIDLETGYSSQYRRVCRDAEALGELRAIAPDVQRVLELAGRRDGLRRMLPGLWQEVRAGYARAESDRLVRKQRGEEKLARLHRETDGLNAEEKELGAKRDAALRRLGELQLLLAQHRQEEEEFRTCLADFEAARLHELETELDRLGAVLAQAVDLDAEKVRDRLHRMTGELATLRRRQEQFARNVASRLQPLLGDGIMEHLFRLLNPEILGLAHGDEGLVVKDEALLAGLLQRFAGQVQEGVYEDDRVRVLLEALPEPDLAVFRDARTLGGRIAELEDAIRREEQLLAAAENAEENRRQRTALRGERDRIKKRLDRFQAHQRRLPEIRQFEAEKGEREQQQLRLEGRLAALAARRTAISVEARDLEDEGRRLETDGQELLRRLHRLTAPASGWPVEPFQAEGRSLEELLGLYDRNHREHEEIAGRYADELRRIEQRTYGRYLGEDEAATLANLKAEVEALAEREKAVQELWKSLAAGLQSAFKGLHRDLATLSMRVDELNRRLGRVSISNLARLRLLLNEHPEWTRRIKTVVEFEAMPLFADPDAAGEAQHQLGELLERNRRVELGDLFDLQFEVTSADGQTRRYPHLDSIESNGTTITIKVLINLMLLKGLLGDREVSIPFYLDEASSLDRDNLIAIVREARRMGFVAVLASPEAMEAADTLYFLRERDGRVLLAPETAMVRIEREGDDGG